MKKCESNWQKRETAMSDDRWQGLLGLAYRARKVVSGEETVLAAVRQGDACLVIISSDASDRTQKTISDKCRHYGIPLKSAADRRTLGNAIGKEARVTLAVTDPGFGKKLNEYL